jgi:hypothetical protein
LIHEILCVLKKYEPIKKIKGKKKSRNFRVCPFSPKKPRFLEKWKNGFCHFWPSEAFAAFVSLLDEFVSFI